MIPTYPRESAEFVALDVLNGSTPATSFLVAVTDWQDRPSVWVTAVELDGEYGFMLTPVSSHGFYRVFVRVTEAPEVPVIDCGLIERS